MSYIKERVSSEIVTYLNANVYKLTGIDLVSFMALEVEEARMIVEAITKHNKDKHDDMESITEELEG